MRSNHQYTSDRPTPSLTPSPQPQNHFRPINPAPASTTQHANPTTTNNHVTKPKDVGSSPKSPNNSRKSQQQYSNSLLDKLTPYKSHSTNPFQFPPDVNQLDQTKSYLEIPNPNQIHNNNHHHHHPQSLPHNKNSNPDPNPTVVFSNPIVMQFLVREQSSHRHKHILRYRYRL